MSLQISYTLLVNKLSFTYAFGAYTESCISTLCSMETIKYIDQGQPQWARANKRQCSTCTYKNEKEYASTLQSRHQLRARFPISDYKSECHIHQYSKYIIILIRCGSIKLEGGYQKEKKMMVYYGGYASYLHHDI